MRVVGLNHDCTGLAALEDTLSQEPVPDGNAGLAPGERRARS